MVIAVALLGIAVAALAVLALRWEQRREHAQEVSFNPAQVEREVYEQLYGERSARISPARPAGASAGQRSETRRGEGARTDSEDPGAGRGGGAPVVRGPMQQT
jgi:hypothetical protein